MASVREPAVAGSFYEDSAQRLTASLQECFRHHLGPGALPQVAADGPRLISALVSPHAGYMFSGPAAAHGFAALAADGLPQTAVILGPSHRIAGRRAALSLVPRWRTPLGEAEVDVALGKELAAACSLIAADEEAHRHEHSLEVQVPFLQFVCGRRMPKICPICVCSHPMHGGEEVAADARQIGEALAKVLSGRPAVVIASTDFSHHIPHALAQRQDRLALDAILALDPDRLLRTVVKHNISMCGPVPVAIALSCCLAMGSHHAELLRYYTSGDVISDRSAVVGYASVVVKRR